MGRHAAPPPPRRSRVPDLPGARTSTATAGFLVAAVAVALAGATVLGLVATGVPLMPRTEAAAAAPTPTPTPIPTLDTSATPASVVIRATLVDSPGRRWAPAGALTWSGGTPFDADCGRPASDAAVAGTRMYAVGARQVVVTVSAYSAGSGAVAFSQWASLLSRCAGASRTLAAIGPRTVGRTAVSAGDAEAFVGWIGARGDRPAASALFWRRGDVVAVVAAASSAPDGLSAAAADLDRVLVPALEGRCRDLASNLADAARSPWIEGVDFTGLTVPVTVSVTPTPLPTPPTPGVETWSPRPLPSVSYPARPLDPVWPTELPSAVASPVPPASPIAPAPVTAVPSRAPDLTGPGCGWDFTGQVVPPFDAEAEQARAEALVQQAHDELVGAQALYASDLLSYWTQIAPYEEQVKAFTAYASAVAGVARQWDTISMQRSDYALALAAYEAALRALADFTAQQTAARAAYDDALLACAAATATPTPTPTDVGVPAPTATPTPTEAAPGCPPTRPAILDEIPPSVPASPSPPPTPGPAPTR